MEEQGHNPSRNVLQTVTLLDALAESRFEAAMGGARRDEEKARAKERFFSHRDRFGQWDPKNQRPELWTLYNGRKHPGEGFRVFPLSNWTEMDVWQYIRLKDIPIPSLYFSHRRDVLRRDGMWLAVSDVITPLPHEQVVNKLGPLSHHRRHDLHRRGGIVPPLRWMRSSWRLLPPASPSAAAAPMTNARTRPWKIAKRWGISDMSPSAHRRSLPRTWTCSASPPPAA